MSGDLALADTRRARSKSKVSWRPAWAFPPDTERFIADILAGEGAPVLHICSGSSQLGDVRVDLEHPAADMKADMYALPFEDGAFPVTVCDPPFPEDAVNLAQRQRQFGEQIRVTAPGGVAILHAPWVPRPTAADLEGVWMRHQVRYGLPFAPVLLTKWRRNTSLDHQSRYKSRTRVQKGNDRRVARPIEPESRIDEHDGKVRQ